MRVPHPVLRDMYRQAATPTQLIERLQRVDEVLAVLAVEPIVGGAGGDALVVRLLSGLQIGELLSGTLARLDGAPVDAIRIERMMPVRDAGVASIEPVRVMSSVRRDMDIESPHGDGFVFPNDQRVAEPLPAHDAAADVRLPQHVESLLHDRFVPEEHPRLARLLRRRGAMPGVHDATKTARLQREQVAQGTRARRDIDAVRTHHTRDVIETLSPPSQERGTAAEEHVRSVRPHARRGIKPIERTKKTTASAGNHRESPRRTEGAAVIDPPIRIDRVSAQERLIALATRGGVTEALHRCVARDVPERMVLALREHEIAASSPTVPPANSAASTTALTAAPAQRLTAILARMDATAVRSEHASTLHHKAALRARTNEHSALPRPLKAVPHEAPSTTHNESPNDVPPPVVKRRPLSAPVSGLRGLAALAQSTTRISTSAPGVEAAPVPRANPATASESFDLAARVSELLRREAERHGIDMTGLEP